MSWLNKLKPKTFHLWTNILKIMMIKIFTQSLKWKAIKTFSIPIFRSMKPSKNKSLNSLKKSHNYNKNFFNKKMSIKTYPTDSLFSNSNNMELNANPKDITKKINLLTLLYPLKSISNLKILLKTLNPTHNILKKLHHSINPYKKLKNPNLQSKIFPTKLAKVKSFPINSSTLHKIFKIKNNLMILQLIQNNLIIKNKLIWIKQKDNKLISWVQ